MNGGKARIVDCCSFLLSHPNPFATLQTYRIITPLHARRFTSSDCARVQACRQAHRNLIPKVQRFHYEVSLVGKSQQRQQTYHLIALE